MKNDYLLAALEPFAKFADAWDANPIKGISTDPLYSIHSGDEQGVINLRDCYTARDAIAKAKAGRLSSTEPANGTEGKGPQLK